MSLRVVINKSTAIAEFSGPGTFEAKEQIKSFGRAKWVSARKVWEVHSFNTSIESLNEEFPDILIEVVGESDDNSPALPNIKITEPQSETVEGLSVSKFLLEVRAALQKKFPTAICIYGVISSLKRTGDRVFIELAEIENPNERVSCVIWQDEQKICEELHKAGFQLEKDLQVMFRAQVGIKTFDGKISLSIISIVAEYTIAKIAALREQTNNRLKKEGLFDLNKQKSLPFLPKRLGILTSKSGTVIHDFQASLDVARFDFELIWFPVSVQGKEAANSIVKGIQYLSGVEELDAILIFRGGGSQAELAVFNDYLVAKAICQCELPVLSAIGHQEDQSSAQDVSCISFGVPKDIGRFFSDIIINFRTQFSDNTQKISIFSKNLIENLENRFREEFRPLVANAKSFAIRAEESVHASGKLIVNNSNSKLINSIDRLRHNFGILFLNSVHFCKQVSDKLVIFEELLKSADRTLDKRELILNQSEALVKQASPEVQLKRGFVIARGSKSDEVITRAEAISISDKINLEFFDNRLLAQIIED